MGFFSRVFSARPDGKRVFLESVLAAARARFIACTFEPVAGAFAIAVRHQGSEALFHLDAAWEQEQRAQLALSRGVPGPTGGVAFVLRVLAAGLVPRGFERSALLARVLPMVIPSVFSTEDAKGLIRRPLRADALESAFALHGERPLWVDRRLLVATGVTPFECASAAVSNLRRRPLRDDDFDLLRGPDGKLLAVFFSRKDELASSWVFHPRLNQILGTFFKEGFHVGVPERELLVAAPADGTALVAVATLVRERYERAESPISPLMYPVSAFQVRE